MELQRLSQYDRLQTNSVVESRVGRWQHTHPHMQEKGAHIYCQTDEHTNPIQTFFFLILSKKNGK